MRMRVRMLCAALMAAATGTAMAQDATLVQVGRLLADPATGRVETDKTLVVVDGRIREVRDGFHAEGGQVVDLRDSFVLPGLIDSHVHLAFENGPNAEIQGFKKTSADLAFDALRYAERTLRAGFTTVADLGGDTEAMNALRDAVNDGRVEGPRILVAGFAGAHGGHGDIHGFRPDVMRMFSSPGLCSGADDCRRAVRQAVQNGADVIKIASTGGVMSNTAAGVGKQMFDDELSAIVQTAHALGRRVVCHAHGLEGVNAALRAGVDSIEHGSYLNAESIRLMKAGGTYLVPTLLAGDTVMRQAVDAPWMPANVKRKAAEVGPLMIDMLGRAWKGGVRVAFGTDSGVSAHGENAREFALMVKAGMSPIDAIRSATVWGAEHNRLSDQIGSLVPGKQADLIAVKGNPLQDVAELERVSYVMRAGRPVSLDP